MTAGNTVRLHRVLRAPPERVYRAFRDPGALCKWLPPYGYTGRMHHFEGRVGGSYRMSFTSLATGDTHSFEARFLELVPDERIVHTDTFDDPALPGQMTVTVTLVRVSCGTELHVVQEGIPAPIPPEACYVGWQESLVQLANLVESQATG